MPATRVLRSSSVLLALALLLPAGSASAFRLELSLDDSVRTFSLDLGAFPQWEFDDGAGSVYRGVLDSMRVSGDLGASFRDQRNITRNFAPFEATLKGRVDDDCTRVRVVLDDKTNGRKLVLATPPSLQSCAGYQP